MHMWQLCHLAMVVPIADAYYEADCLEKAGKEWKTERKTAKRLKRNFCFLKKKIAKAVKIGVDIVQKWIDESMSVAH